MKRTLRSTQYGLVVLVAAMLLAPTSAEPVSTAQQAGWIEQLTGFVLMEEAAALANGHPGMFDLYLDQLTLVRRSYEHGDQERTYAAMNRFMDMLEAREGEISTQAADAMWDYCYRVTPRALHDAKRHKQWWDKTVDWEKFFWEE